MPYLVCQSLGLALGRACREASFLLRRPQADLEPLPRSSAKCRLPNKQRSGGPLGCRGRSSIPGNSGISSITFGAAAAARFWEAQQSRWRNAKVRPGWVGFMRRHAAKIWNVPVDQVDQPLMVQILQSIWIANSALLLVCRDGERRGRREDLSARKTRSVLLGFRFRRLVRRGLGLGDRLAAQ
jgi:hypothetical protein